MKLRKNSIALVCLVSSCFLPSAHAFDVSLLGAMTVSNYSLSAPTDIPSSTGVAFGLGGTVGFDLNPFFSIETGLLYLKHSYSTNLNLTNQSFTYDYTTIPLLLRLNPISLISFGAGFYYGIATSTSVDTTVGTAVSTTMDSPHTNDFGLMAGVGVRLPLIPMLLKLRADVLYEFGLVNLSATPGVSQKARNLDFFAGLMLDI